MRPERSVSVIVVTWNSAGEVAACLDSVLVQGGVVREVVVVDNGSTDGTLDLLAGYRDRVRVIRNGCNLGFAEGSNIGIRASSAPFVLTLNADARLAPGALERLVAALHADPDAGAASGKLVKGSAPGRLDSTGIALHPFYRFPFDRGENEADCGQYDGGGYVFGVTGAAGFYRRVALEEVAVEGEFFDRDFFAYYEDVDLAWRLQRKGWRTLYVPEAVIFHDRRGPFAQPPGILGHFFKNRYLCLLKNEGLGRFLLHLPFHVVREFPWALMMLVRHPELRGEVGSLLRLAPVIWRKRQRTAKGFHRPFQHWTKKSGGGRGGATQKRSFRRTRRRATTGENA